MSRCDLRAFRPWLRLIAAIAVGTIATATAAEVMPPKPARYFNDYAEVVPMDREAALNARLEQFERETSNQIVVAVFAKMESDSSLEDYTVRIFQSWGVGQRDRDNGAVLFVFLNDRKMRIEVGYGLEPVLTDAESARIIEGLKPHFRGGDFAGGLAFAVEAMIAATKGEFQGSGKTVRETQQGVPWPVLIFFFSVFILILIDVIRKVRRGWVYDHNGRSRLPADRGGWWMPTGGGGWSGSSGGWSSGGGGGFSGGGGSSGGGGASGSW